MCGKAQENLELFGLFERSHSLNGRQTEESVLRGALKLVSGVALGWTLCFLCSSSSLVQGPVVCYTVSTMSWYQADLS